MNFLGNIIWLIFEASRRPRLFHWRGCIMHNNYRSTWGFQCFKLVPLVLWPFGKKVVSDSSNTGCLSTIENVIWIVSGGLMTAITHFFMGLLLSITIITFWAVNILNYLKFL